MTEDFDYSEYIAEKTEQNDTTAVPMREQRKLKVELYDLYRMEL